jgi:putative glutamine amidotransferase
MNNDSKYRLNNKNRLLIIISIFISVFIIISCGKKTEYLKIAISKGYKSDTTYKYDLWLKNIDSNIIFIDLYKLPKDSALKLLETCSGLILSGGPDISPERYGRAKDSNLCKIDFKRDTLEFALIEKARLMQLPLLAVCRGEQLLNVAYGGSLIVDIPTEKPSEVIHRCDTAYVFHKVIIFDNSILNKITGEKYVKVNTNHHQAVDRLADVFKTTAISDKDSVIEAYEWKEPEGKQFLIAVQWHPERLPYNNPLSYAIANTFIDEVVKWKIHKK